MLNDENLEVLKQVLSNKTVAKFSLSGDFHNLYPLSQLNYDLNHQNLIYPYVRLNNYKNTTSYLDFNEKTNNKHLNHLDNKLSLKSILYRLAKGDTLMVDYIDLFNDDVKNFISNLSKKITAKITSNIYYTFKNTTGINLHFDQHDVIICQTHGRKIWHFITNIIELTNKPMSKITKPNLESNSVITKTIIMEEGDYLFIPKGMWHYTETDADSSLHLAFGLTPPTILDITNFLLSHNFSELQEQNMYNLDQEKILYALQEQILKLNNVDINNEIVDKIQSCFQNKYMEIELV